MEDGGSSNSHTNPDANCSNSQASRRDTDRYLPMTNVARIMRKILPPHARIADDTKEIMQECVSQFIGYITIVANQKCHGEYRKTISADDIISAMTILGFNDYIEPLTVYLDKFRELDNESNPALRLPVVNRGVNFTQPQVTREPSPPPKRVHSSSQIDEYYNVCGHGEGCTCSLYGQFK